MSSSLDTTEAASAAVATAPRVSLAEIRASIAETIHLTGAEMYATALLADRVPEAARAEAIGQQPSLATLSVCVLVMRNGFVVIGKSAPASSANFDAALGRQFAYEDAVRQVWPLMGYALRDRLSVQAPPSESSPAT